MPINTNEDVKAKLTVATFKQKKELEEVIEDLDFADLFRGPGTIAKSGNVRIDNQGVWSGGPGFNIQAQIGSNSIAAVRVADSLGAATADNRAAVMVAVGAALMSSLASGNWVNVTGTSP